MNEMEIIHMIKNNTKSKFHDCTTNVCSLLISTEKVKQSLSYLDMVLYSTSMNDAVTFLIS